MTETKPPLRLATTAIAAALAVSSIPVLAQDAPPPDTAVEAPAPSAPDPLAPATDTSIVPTTVAPDVSPAASEAAPASAAKARPARRAATTATRSAPAPTATAATPAPAVVAAEPVETLPVAEAPIAPPPPVTIEPAASRQMQTTAMLMIAGAGALLLAALVAAAVMLRRRRRRREELVESEVYETEPEVVEPAPAMVAEPEPGPVRTEPRFVTAAVPAAVPAAAPAVAAAAPAAASAATVEGPVTELPEGFDLSRFGHNVQAAYRGPTTDNPSLSLKHRLRKAAAMDQMERNMDAEVEAATGESVLDEADAAPAVADPAPGGFLLTTPGRVPANDPARTH